MQHLENGMRDRQLKRFDFVDSLRRETYAKMGNLLNELYRRGEMKGDMSRTLHNLLDKHVKIADRAKDKNREIYRKEDKILDKLKGYKTY